MNAWYERVEDNTQTCLYKVHKVHAIISVFMVKLLSPSFIFCYFSSIPPLIFIFFQDIHKSVDQNPFLAASNYPFK